MHRQLDRIDRYIASHGRDSRFPHEARSAAIPVSSSLESIDLRRENIRTILWATGFRRDYSWLKVPITDESSELIHRGGITPARGLYALGLHFMRRRNSSFLDGVGADAADLSEHLVAHRQHHRRVFAVA